MRLPIWLGSRCYRSWERNWSCTADVRAGADFGEHRRDSFDRMVRFCENFVSSPPRHVLPFCRCHGAVLVGSADTIQAPPAAIIEARLASEDRCVGDLIHPAALVLIDVISEHRNGEHAWRNAPLGSDIAF